MLKGHLQKVIYNTKYTSIRRLNPNARTPRFRVEGRNHTAGYAGNNRRNRVLVQDQQVGMKGGGGQSGEVRGGGGGGG